MTGYRSSFFRHSCEQRGCYIDGLPCWDDLIEAMPRSIRPTDVDGFIEINGQFLFLEEKGAGKHLEEGQRKALRALTTWPGHTVLCFRPKTGGDHEFLVFKDGEGSGWRECSRSQLKAWIRNWCVRADAPQGGAA